MEIRLWKRRGLKKRKKIAKTKLPFAVDDGDGDHAEDDGTYEHNNATLNPSSYIPSPSKKTKFGRNPTVDMSFPPKSRT
jgi:hypothetical protein